MDHPEPISKRVPEIPQCRKGFSLEEARNFIDQVMQVFHNLEDMTDLRSMYETGKQLSRLYFDCHQHRVELAQYLTSLDYPAYSSKMMKKLNNMGVFKNDNIWFSSFYFYNTTWNFSEIWPEFATALATAGLPNLLNLNIGHQPYLDNLPSKNVYYLVKASLSIIHNIARVPGNMHCFSSETVKTALTNRCLREEEFLRCISDLCLAYVVTDSDINLITSVSSSSNSSSILQCLMDHVVSAKASEKRRFQGFQVFELLSALATLAVNDSIKSKMLSMSSSSLTESYTCVQIIKEAVEAAMPSSTTVMIQREAEECVRLLWNLSMDSQSANPASAFYQQVGPWLLNTMQSDGLNSLPLHIIRALEAISIRLSPSTRTNNFGSGQILVSFAPANRAAALKLAERLKNANLPVFMLDSLEADVSSLADASIVGMSGLYYGLHTLNAWKKILDSASLLVMCASEAYRLSPCCRFEVECMRTDALNINMVGGDAGTNILGNLPPGKLILPVCLQPKYKPVGWLADAIGGNMMIDLSGRRDIESSYENVINQVQRMHSEIKQVLNHIAPIRKQSAGIIAANMMIHEPPNNYIDTNIQSNRQRNDSTGLVPAGGPLLGVSCTTSLGRDGSLPKNTGQIQRSVYPSGLLLSSRATIRPEVRNWSTNTVTDWLKFRGNNQILQVVGAFNGLVLSELAALRFWAPEYFARALQTELHLSFIDGLRLIAALDELTISTDDDDCCGQQDGFDDRADAYSHASACNNTGTR